MPKPRFFGSRLPEVLCMGACILVSLWLTGCGRNRTTTVVCEDERKTGRTAWAFEVDRNTNRVTLVSVTPARRGIYIANPSQYVMTFEESNGAGAMRLVADIDRFTWRGTVALGRTEPERGLTPAIFKAICSEAPPESSVDASVYASWATAAFTLLAVFAASYYAYLTKGLLQLERTPFVRLVWYQSDTHVVVKNIGRSPAAPVVLVDKDGAVMGAVDALEPLGPAVSPGGEKERVGRVVMRVERPLSIMGGFPYFLYYQDLAGKWHLTKAVGNGSGFVCEFKRKIAPMQVPKLVREKAEAISAYEMLTGSQSEGAD